MPTYGAYFIVADVSTKSVRTVGGREALPINPLTHWLLGLTIYLSQPRPLPPPHPRQVTAFLRPGETDEVFAKRLTVEAGVTTIPISGFYLSEGAPTHLVRFCYCKDDAKLLTACDKLEAYFAKKP